MTGPFDPDRLSLIARGGQADIYDAGDGKVLRLARRPQDFDRIRYEYEVYACLGAAGLPVPRAYELLEVRGAPAILMDRVDGGSLMARIRGNPLTARAVARELAQLHLQILGHEAPSLLTRAKAKSEFCIRGSSRLSEDSKKRLLSLLDGLPEGTAVCHGDFHPGNVLRHRGKSYIIDWSAASRGDFHADVAHSFLLMRVVPKVPGTRAMMHLLQRSIGRAIASTYLSTVGKDRPLDRRRLSKWVLLNAAERTYHGLPSEQDALGRFIEKGLALLAENPNQEHLHELI